MRVNGFDRPFHPLQVMTWFVFPVILFGYYGVVMPMLSKVLLYVSCVVYSILAVLTFLSAWITSAIDPRDARVGEAQRRQQQAPRSGSRLSRCCEPLAMGPAFEYVNLDESLSETDTIVCYLCEARVDSSSKHCRFCDKCVVRFDHHCKWLNTCIGQRNYAYFLCVIGSTWLFATLQLALTAYLLIRLTVPSLRASVFLRRAQNHILLPTKSSVLIALGTWCGILLPLVGLVGQLGAFHLMLLGEGLTTYEYIINEQRKEDNENSTNLEERGSTTRPPKPPGDRPNCCRETKPRQRPAPPASSMRTTSNGQGEHIELTTKNNNNQRGADFSHRAEAYRPKQKPKDTDLAAFEEQALDVEDLDDDDDDLVDKQRPPSEDDGFDSDGHFRQQTTKNTQETFIHILDDSSKHSRDETHL